MKPSGLLQTPVQGQRFETIAIDHFGPLLAAPTLEKWVSVIEDTSIRWTEMFSLKGVTAEACSRCLIDEIVLRFGTPRTVIMDGNLTQLAILTSDDLTSWKESSRLYDLP